MPTVTTLEMTRPFEQEFEMVKEVRGLGLMYAIEFGEPRSLTLMGSTKKPVAEPV